MPITPETQNLSSDCDFFMQPKVLAGTEVAAYPRAGRQHKKPGGESLGGGETQSSERRCKQGETTHLRDRRTCIMGEATLLFHAVPGTGKAGGAGEQQQPALNVIYGRVLNNRMALISA